MGRNEKKILLRRSVLEEFGWDCRNMNDEEFWEIWISVLLWLNTCMSFRQLSAFIGLAALTLRSDLGRANARIIRDRGNRGRNPVPVRYKNKWYVGGINELKNKFNLPYHTVHRSLAKGHDLEQLSKMRKTTKS